MNVSAEHTDTGLIRLKNNISITNHKGRPSSEEIERMVEDAEKYKLEDEEHTKKVEARYCLENYAYNMRNAIRSAAKITPADKEKMEDAFGCFMQWLISHEDAAVDDYKDKMNEFQTVFNTIICNMS